MMDFNEDDNKETMQGSKDDIEMIVSQSFHWNDNELMMYDTYDSGNTIKNSVENIMTKNTEGICNQHKKTGKSFCTQCRIFHCESCLCMQTRIDYKANYGLLPPKQCNNHNKPFTYYCGNEGGQTELCDECINQIKGDTTDLEAIKKLLETFIKKTNAIPIKATKLEISTAIENAKLRQTSLEKLTAKLDKLIDYITSQWKETNAQSTLKANGKNQYVIDLLTKLNNFYDKFPLNPNNDLGKLINAFPYDKIHPYPNTWKKLSEGFNLLTGNIILEISSDFMLIPYHNYNTEKETRETREKREKYKMTKCLNPRNVGYQNVYMSNNLNTIFFKTIDKSKLVHNRKIDCGPMHDWAYDSTNNWMLVLNTHNNILYICPLADNLEKTYHDEKTLAIKDVKYMCPMVNKKIAYVKCDALHTIIISTITRNFSVEDIPLEDFKDIATNEVMLDGILTKLSIEEIDLETFSFENKSNHIKMIKQLSNETMICVLEDNSVNECMFIDSKIQSNLIIKCNCKYNKDDVFHCFIELPQSVYVYSHNQMIHSNYGKRIKSINLHTGNVVEIKQLVGNVMISSSTQEIILWDIRNCELLKEIIMNNEDPYLFINGKEFAFLNKIDEFKADNYQYRSLDDYNDDESTSGNSFSKNEEPSLYLYKYTWKITDKEKNNNDKDKEIKP